MNFPEFTNLDDNAWINLFGKFKSNLLPENHNLALKYHGHQFQTYNPELGDGRGFTIAQFYHNKKYLGACFVLIESQKEVWSNQSKLQRLPSSVLALWP